MKDSQTLLVYFCQVILKKIIEKQKKKKNYLR